MGILITIYLQDTPRLFVDKTADPLDSASSCQSPDSWLGNALNKLKLVHVQNSLKHCEYLNVVPQDFTVPLSTTLAQAFASFPTSSHGESLTVNDQCFKLSIIYENYFKIIFASYQRQSNPIETEDLSYEQHPH